MLGLYELMTVSPQFVLKKLLGAPRDMNAPRMYHASTVEWNVIRKAPVLYTAYHAELSLTHMAYRIRNIGDSITINMYELELPVQAFEDKYSYTYTGVWNADVREYVESILTDTTTILILYKLAQHVEESMSIAIKARFVRVVDIHQYTITKIAEPAVGERIPNSNIYITPPEQLEDNFEIEVLERV